MNNKLLTTSLLKITKAQPNHFFKIKKQKEYDAKTSFFDFSFCRLDQDELFSFSNNLE